MTLPNRLPELVDAYLDGDLDTAETQQLGDWLLEDNEHARRFLNEVRVHREMRNCYLAQGDSECLKEAGTASSHTPPPTMSPPSTPTLGWLGELTQGPGVWSSQIWFTLLAVLLLIGGGVLWIGRHAGPEQDPPGVNQLAETLPKNPAPQVGKQPTNKLQSVARVIRLWKPKWSDQAQSLAEWAPLVEGQIIDLAAGKVEVFFDAGAHLVLQGPVRFEVLGPKSGRVFHGDLTARIGEQAKGFSLITAAGKVVDLGTEFGVSVQPDGETDVVVFDGTVDLEQLPAVDPNNPAKLATTDSGALMSRLTTGEAVRVKPDGSKQRIVSVDSDRFAWTAMDITFKREKPAVIQSVSDTIRKPGAGPFYEIVHGGLDEDVRAYVDRPYEWNGVDKNGIPEFLRGADYIKTFNDDKRRDTYKLTVELAQPADLYVFWNERLKAPDWLEKEFSNTGLKIGMDESAFRRVTYDPKLLNPEFSTALGAGNSIDQVYTIWRREVPAAGKITLGTNTLLRPASMYGVAAVAKNMHPKEGVIESKFSPMSK